MNIQSASELAKRHCLPSNGGVMRMTGEEAKQQLKELPGWELTQDGKRIGKAWRVKNFMTGIDFFNRCATIAEQEAHHPDLHIQSYREVVIELWTHVIDGLSENDFIVAAKIDQLPIELAE